jgi:hypothetical protein
MTVAEPATYSLCGLRLRSELELNLPLCADGVWDVDIRWGADIDNSGAPPPGKAIASFIHDDVAWYTATVTESGYMLRFKNCGEFFISADLRDLEVRRDRSGEVTLLPILLAGTVSAFLLALRGETVLHASAVSIDGAAIAFVGQSGRGKSTIAALLCVAGAELVTDDVLTIDAGPPVTCTGGASELRLRQSAASIGDGQPATTTRMTADDRLALAVKTSPQQPLPVAALVIPSPSRTASSVEFKRLEPSTALFALLSFPRVHGWQRPDVLTRDFSALTDVVNRVPTYDATIPWGPPFDPGVADALFTLASEVPEL